MWRNMRKSTSTVPVAPSASVTRTENTQSGEQSHAGGGGKVPVSVRPANAMPVGSTPAETLYLYGARPPLCVPKVPQTVTQPTSTVHRKVQALPTARCGTIETVRATPAAAPAASSTRTTNEKLPADVGLPVTAPPVDSAMPGGRAPVAIAHLYGCTPPLAPRATIA